MRSTVEADPHFKRILEILLRDMHFDAGQYKPNYVKRRVAVRMRATGAPTYPESLRVLQGNPGEASLLFDRLTIHVTEFFRDPSLYQALQENVLPELAGRAGDPFRAWCAGCSTGEEPYSLALLLGDWRDAHAPFPFEIWATDIDEPSVRTAEKGEYPLEALRRIPRAQVAKGFRVEGLQARVAPEVKGAVRFKVQDLLGDWGPGWPKFDLVSCRNLLIYLSSPQQQKLYERFYHALRPGGCLILGLTETILGEARRFFRCTDLRNRVYRAVEGVESTGSGRGENG